MNLFDVASEKFGRFSNKLLLQDKLNTLPGYLLSALIAIGFGYCMSKNYMLGFGILGLIIGGFTIILCLISPEIGLYLNILYSFLAFHLSRFMFNNEFPVGVVSDILIVATFMGLFTGAISKREFPRSPVIVCFFILYAYIGIELFNPYAHSFSGWFQTIRKILAEFLLLYIGYNVLSNYKTVKRFIVTLFVLCTICGLYGCVQQWHGLFPFELAWATGDENRLGLIFINGDFRKFSTMPDPTAFGVIMAASSVFFIVLATGIADKLKRYVIFTGVILMLLGLAYSGTRTANAMAVAGLVLFVLLTINNKATRVFAIIGTIIFLILLYGPFYGNATINRFRSTFQSDDESYKVRQINKAFIQPYIHAHPIGGGLGTTGAGGLRYNGSHPLAGFPPDSGYLKIALEFGWIGLAIICVLYFTVLRNAIRAYFSIEDKKLKMIIAGCISFFFCFYVGQFAQDSLGQITDIVIYYPLVALSLRAKHLDAAKVASE